MKEEEEEVEELERILGEKVEHDEEWRELEIVDVKPVYTGEYKESLIKVPSQAIVLTVLAKYFEIIKRKSVKITKFANIVFEVEKKVIEPILSEPLLDAKDFDSFTVEIYDHLCLLQNLDLVEIAKDEVGITDKGIETFDGRIDKEIPKEITRMIERIVEEYCSLSHGELLWRVYNEYPKFAEKSLI